MIGIPSDEKKSDKISLSGLPLSLSLYELLFSIEKKWIKEVITKKLSNEANENSFHSFSSPKDIQNEKTITFPYLSKYENYIPVEFNDIKSITQGIVSFNLKYAIFCDLWEKGYYILVGNKMGADFIVYKNDPLVVHASFIVKVLKWDEYISSMDYVMISRIANGSNKSLVLASIDENGEIRYIKSDWIGVS